MEEFCTQLLHCLRKREQLNQVFEQEQVAAGIDELKLQLLKLVLMYQNALEPLEKTLVEGCVPDGQKSFNSFIAEDLVKQLNATKKAIARKEKPPRFWNGVRQEVELPADTISYKTQLKPKSILPELLNQRFLWHEKYHHYDDWEQKMKDSYDQFNLLELPKKGGKDAPSLYFDPVNFNRRIPNGIYPDAKSPRVVLMPPGSELQTVDERDTTSKLDAMTRFERSPIETMVSNEL